MSLLIRTDNFYFELTNIFISTKHKNQFQLHIISYDASLSGLSNIWNTLTFESYVTYFQTIKMILYTNNNVSYPLELLFISRTLINDVKSLQIRLHALNLNRNVFTLRIVSSGLIYSTVCNS